MPLTVTIVKPSSQFSQSVKDLQKVYQQKTGQALHTSSGIPKNSRFYLYGHQINKALQYEWCKVQQLPGLEYTEDKQTAQDWSEQGEVVIARTLLNGEAGAGIEVIKPGDVWVNAPIYTKYKKKKKEFRVHVFKDKVVTVLEKRKKKELYNGNFYIRNHKNGYVFCHNDVVEPLELRSLALLARKVTQSDFVGVDIGYNETKKELFIIEVNSAPGMENTTVELYCNQLIQDATSNV